MRPSALAGPSPAPEPAQAAKPLLPSDGFVDRTVVCRLIGIERATLRRMIQRGVFPQPDYRIGSSPRWDVRTVRAWFDQKVRRPRP